MGQGQSPGRACAQNPTYYNNTHSSGAFDRRLSLPRENRLGAVGGRFSCTVVTMGVNYIRGKVELCGTENYGRVVSMSLWHGDAV
jgi:hypothetical protein